MDLAEPAAAVREAAGDERPHAASTSSVVAPHAHDDPAGQGLDRESQYSTLGATHIVETAGSLAEAGPSHPSLRAHIPPATAKVSDWLSLVEAYVGGGPASHKSGDNVLCSSGSGSEESCGRSEESDGRSRETEWLEDVGVNAGKCGQQRAMSSIAHAGGGNAGCESCTEGGGFWPARETESCGLPSVVSMVHAEGLPGNSAIVSPDGPWDGENKGRYPWKVAWGMSCAAGWCCCIEWVARVIA